MNGRRWWWASQSKNYRTAIPAGTLWSCDIRRPDGSSSPRRDRRFLQDMRRGDGVLHYADGFLRAVSVVRAPWTETPRPAGYPKVRAGDLDSGWLVRVEPLVTELEVPFGTLSPLLGAGVDRPFGSDGRPAQKYISRVEADEAERVIALIGETHRVDLGDLSTQLGVDDVPEAATDALSVASVRLEQRALRQRLLQSAAGKPSCVLCGECLPTDFLVAAHVLPRRMLLDSERMHFDDVAVLMCLLGCDALYERGLITVRDGVITARDAVPVALQEAVQVRTSRVVQARSARQSALFAEHDLLHRGGAVRANRVL